MVAGIDKAGECGSGPAGLCQGFVVAPGVGWVAGEDGVVVLEPVAGQYFTFNGVADFVWRSLAGGHAPAATLAALGERYPVGPERLAADFDRLLARLLALGLLVPGSAGLPHQERTPELPTVPRRLAEAGTARLGRFAQLRLAFVAWWGLLALDLLLFGRGFAHFRRFVASTPVSPSDATLGAEGIAALCQAVDRGARFYVKRAWCLQRSALTTWLLRRRGVAAEMVIGVRAVPFLAHAWVEIGGAVANDKPTVQRFYDAILRC